MKPTQKTGWCWDDDIFFERWANRPKRRPPPSPNYLILAKKLVAGGMSSTEFRMQINNRPASGGFFNGEKPCAQ